MKRHIGKITNTDQRCVVVYLQIPGRDSHALVVSADNLPLSVETFLMQVLESPEGQADPTLANVLARRTMPDSGRNLLQTLHDMNLLQAIPVDQIVMLPLPNMPFPLRAIIEQNGGVVPASTSQPEIPNAETNLYNPYGQSQAIEASAQNTGIARNLIVEANLLHDEAERKREMAYRYDPSLRPQPLVAPVEAAVAPVVVDSVEKIVKRSRAKKTA